MKSLRSLSSRVATRRTGGAGSTNHVSYIPNSFKGEYIGNYGTTIGVIKGDTRSLDSGSCGLAAEAQASPNCVGLRVDLLAFSWDI